MHRVSALIIIFCYFIICIINHVGIITITSDHNVGSKSAVNYIISCSAGEGVILFIAIQSNIHSHQLFSSYDGTIVESKLLNPV